jgi:hypothetical protein
MKQQEDRIDVNILVTYRIEKPKTGEVIEDNVQEAYVASLRADITANDSVEVELIVRKLIPTTLLERANKGDTRFAYDQPAVWIEITSLALQSGDSPIYQLPTDKLLKPKELAIAYQRPQLRNYWEKIGVSYKEEVADLKKVQH